MPTYLDLTKNRYSSRHVVENAKDPALTQEYADRLKKAEDRNLKIEKEIEERKKKETWSISIFDPKKGLGGFFFFEKKEDAEQYLQQEIKHAVGMIQAIKKMTGDASKEEKALEKYKREAKVVQKIKINESMRYGFESREGQNVWVDQSMDWDITFDSEEKAKEYLKRVETSIDKNMKQLKNTPGLKTVGEIEAVRKKIKEAKDMVKTAKIKKVVG